MLPILHARYSTGWSDSYSLVDDWQNSQLIGQKIFSPYFIAASWASAFDFSTPSMHPNKLRMHGTRNR